ncbi:MAG: hypothetical protein HFI86_05900 [Bacilli bacterium]|nr:hypothetical protein [Bacilli bacterium]
MSGIKKITDEVKSAVSKSVEPMKNLTTQAKNMASKSASSVAQMKAQMKSYSSSIQETTKQQELLKSKINDLKASLSMPEMFHKSEILEMEAEVEKLENKLKKLQSQGQNTGKGTTSVFDRIKEKIKLASTHIVGLNDKFKKTLTGSKNLSKGFTSTFNNGVKSIKKFAMGLLSVRTTISMVSKAIQSYLSYDSQLSNSIQNCWNVLGSLLAPVLERIVNLFSTAVSYVNAFVKSLTGVDLVTRANTKSLNAQAKASKNASNQLSGIDDINNLTTNNNSGDDKQAITVEPVDLGNLDLMFDWIEKVKQLLATLFDPIKEAWKNKGQAFIESIKNAFDGIKQLGTSVFSSILEVWSNGSGQKVAENYITAWTTLLNIVGSLGKVLSNAWNNANSGTNIIQSIVDIFTSLQEISISIYESLLNWIISPEFQEVANIIVSLISDLFGYLSQISTWIATMYETYLAPVVNKILSCISNIIVAIGSVWEFLKPIIDVVIDNILNVLEPVIDGLCGIIGGIIDALSGVMEFITGVFTGDWEKVWNGIKQFMSGIVSAIRSFFNSLYNTIVALFKGAWETIKTVWSVVANWFNNTIIKPITSFFSGMWSNVINGASSAWNGIKNVFSSVASFFGNIFSEAWNKVKNVFSVGGQIFSGIKEGIENTFKTVVNTLIAGINKIVAIPFNAINGMLNKIRNIEFLNIAPFKGLWKQDPLYVPQIPSLANGGVLFDETIVRVAEYSNARSNPEVVSPVDIMDRTFRNALNDTNLGTRIDRLTIKYLDENVYDGVVEYINEQNRIKGVSIIKEVD